MRPDSGKFIQLHPEFLAAVQDPETYEAAVACAKGQGWPAAAVINADLSAVIQAIGRARPPAIIIADIDGADDPVSLVAQLVKVCANRSKILTVGSANDVSSYRAIVQAGAVDYLVKPVNSVALRDAVIPLLTNRDEAKNEKRARAGQVHVFIGVRGGVGTTTAAVNTAWILAHEGDRKVALLDLDLQFGNSDLALDLEPGRGLRELLANPDRMDALLINSAMTKESDQLSVFCSEETLEEVVEFDTAGPVSLLKSLTSEYDDIIIDMPRSMIGRHRRLLVSADHVFLVTDLTLAGIRDVPRVAMAVANLGNANPVHVIAGRIGDGEAQVDRATFERGIRARIEGIIPHDTVTVKISSNRGKAVPVVAPSAALTRALRKIAVLMVGRGVIKASVENGGLMATLTGFFKKG